MKMSRMLIVGIALALLVGVVGGYAFNEMSKPKTIQHIRFTTGWVLGGYAAPYVLAVKKGYYTQEGLDVKVVRGYGAGDAAIKIAAGTYDAGHADISSLMEFKAKNPDADVIAIAIIYDAAPFAITTLPGKGVQTPKDLEGKKISSTIEEPTRLLFPIFARKVGIDPDKVKWETVSAALRSSRVVTGDANAVAGYATTVAGEMKGLNVDTKTLIVFKYADFGLPVYGNAIIVRKSWAERFPDAAKGLVKGSIRGWLDAAASPKSAIDALLEAEPLVKADVETFNLELVLNSLVLTKRAKELGIGYASDESIRQAIATIVEGFQLPKTPDSADIYTSKYLPPKSERIPSV